MKVQFDGIWVKRVPPNEKRAALELRAFMRQKTDLSAEMLGVGLLVRFPLFRQIIGGENGRHRANRYARTAVNTFHWIDEELIGRFKSFFIFLGMDTIHRAGIDAGGIFRADAGFCNHVSHG
jgi:hypothetical protein